MTDSPHDYEANEVRIADYIDSRMSAAEEEAFMLELGSDALLRQQYEEELLMRALLREHGQEAPEIMLQPADEHLVMMEDALRERGGGYFRWLAAAAVFVLCGVLIWLAARRNHVTPAASPEVVRKDSEKPLKADADSVFARNYTAYTRDGDDPVQASIYYNYYREGKFSKVVKAKDADLGQLGFGEGVAPQEYLHFYQGLSLLAMQDAGAALVRFGEVMDKLSPRNALYAKAEWYSVLAYLKNKETERSAALARHIVQTNSPYKQQAGNLLKALE